MIPSHMLGSWILLGSAFGSFVTVLVARVPGQRGLVKSSHCQNCGKTILWRDNIPLISFLLLRGRCRFCKNKIGYLYPLTEVTVCGLIVLVVLHFPAWFVALSWIAFVVLGTALAIIDLKFFRLPDFLTLSLACIVVALLISDALKNGHHNQLKSALICSFSLFTFYLLINILSRGGMGMGDAKLAITIGFITGYNGWRSTFIATLVAFTGGALVGIGLILFKGAGRKTAVPFGPFMLAGCYASIWLAPIIENALPH